jgi:hypothetical protein
MSIRWIRNVYVRVNQDEEYWFRPASVDRRAVLAQGLDLLRSKMDGRSITESNGSAFSWH